MMELDINTSGPGRSDFECLCQIEGWRSRVCELVDASLHSHRL